MLYQRWRSLLTVILFLLAILIHVQVGWSSAWPLYAGAGFLLLTYLLLGTTRAAMDALQRGNLFLAERILRFTRFPGVLIRPNRAQYFFLQGLIQLQQKNLDEGRDALEKALATGLRHPSEKGLALLNLAHIHFVQGKYSESRKYLEQAKEVGADDLKLRDRLRELEDALAGKA